MCYHICTKHMRKLKLLFCQNVIKFFRREIGEIVRHLPDKIISAPSQTVATAWITPKICRGQPQHLSHTVPDFIQIVHLQWSYSPMCKGCSFEYFHNRLFEPA